MTKANTNPLRWHIPSRFLIAATTALAFVAGMAFSRTTLAADAAAKNERSAGTVQHIIIIWLKEPGNVEHKNRMVEGLRKLAAIPGVKSVTVGSVLPAERNPSDLTRADSTFDLSVVITLENEEAYRGYIKHPIHDLMARNTMAPLVDRFKMYDTNLFE